MKARTLLLLLVPALLGLMAACGGPTDLEPAAESGAPVDPGRPNGTPTPAPSTTPTPTLIVRPVGTATQAATNMTPTATPGPRPTSTPVRPFPGFIYRNGEGVWRVGADWQPVQLSTRPDAKLSPDGQRLLYIENGDVFVQDVEGGEAINVTGGSNWEHLHAQWWPARPETLVLMSTKRGAAEPNEGYLTLVTIDGEDHRRVGNSASYALPAPGPDGETIAYDEEGTAMLYHMESGPEPFDPAAYGVPADVSVPRIASPAWSFDGNRLAWMMAVEGADYGADYGNENGWDVVAGVFDLRGRTATLLHPFRPAGRGGWFAAPSWSPDGRWLVFPVETGDADNGLWVAATNGSSERQLTKNANALAFWSPPGSESWQNGSYLAISPASQDGGGDYLVLETASWYEVPLYIPEGGVIVAWRATS